MAFRVIKIVAALMLFASSALAADWYVDDDATGANNGTSWANAFTNLNQMTEAWQQANISAGANIYITNGTYSGLTVRRGGTAANPVTYKAVGPIQTGSFTIAGNSVVDANWVTLDGSIDPSYTNQITSTIEVPNITNNIQWTMFKTLTGNDQGANITQTGDGKTGLTVKWIELTHTNIDLYNESYGISQKNSSGTRASATGYATNKFLYLWIHNISQDAFKNSGQDNSVGFDGSEIGWCLIEETGDDGIEANGSLYVHNNIIRDARDDLNRGHPDAWSGAGLSHTKFANNIMWGFERSQIMYGLTLKTYNTNIWVYGNLCYWGHTNSAQTAKTIGALGMEDLWFNYNDPYVDTNCYWVDVRIFNNTWIAHPPEATTAWSFFNRYAHAAGGENVAVNASSLYMANNIKYGGNSGLGWPSYASVEWIYDSADAFLWNNISWGTDTSSSTNFSFNGTSYANGPAVNAAVATASGNSSEQPIFVAGDDGDNGTDFRLDATDTAARDNGTNLTAFVSEMEGLDVDIWGNTRGVDGTWDIGAHEYPESTAPTVTGVDASGTNGIAFVNYQISATQAPTAYGADNLPAGLSLDGETGIISGTPTEAVTNTVTLYATNAIGSDSDTATFSIAQRELILWLQWTNTLTDPFTNGVVVDSSGFSNHAVRFSTVNNFYGDGYPEHMPTNLIVNNYSGSYTGTAGAFMEKQPDQRSGFYWGDWLAVTNVTQFTNLNQMTVAAWAAYDNARDNYSATIISSGEGPWGTWSLGRFFPQSNTNGLSFTVSTNFNSPNWEYDKSMVLLANVEDSTWHHYAVTFSNNVVYCYLDGEPVITNTLTMATGKTNLTVFDSSVDQEPGQGFKPWLAVGCRTHNGNPTISDWTDGNDYPNNGWWSGGIGDVRIYSRALSANEVATIYAEGSGEAAPPDPEPPASGGAGHIQQANIETLSF